MGAPAARWNPVLAVLSVLGACALGVMPFLRVAPNRLVSGEPVSWWAVLQGPAWGLVALLLGLLLAAFMRPSKALLWAVAAGATFLGTALVWQVGAQALMWAHTATDPSSSPLVRTSLGGGFWVVLLMLWLITTDTLQRLQVGLLARAMVVLAVLFPLSAMLVLGWCDELSLMKEYANRSDVFAAAMGRHLLLVALTLVFTLGVGLPLGWAVQKKVAVRRALFPVLNLIQTVPSIALFGLLMAPLALLAGAFPLLARMGISGIGLAPGVIALTLYSLLPIVRGTQAGLEQVPTAVLQAARGMGMAPWQLFWRIEVPLALPLLLAGVRTATVQAVGLAAVTALIGAGGLGAIMFEGLFSSAQDVVLLGVVPIIALTVLADAGFKVLIQCLQIPAA